MQNKKWIRVGALIMAVVMGFGLVTSVLFSILGS